MTVIATKERAAATLLPAKENAVLVGDKHRRDGGLPTATAAECPRGAVNAASGSSVGTHPSSTAAEGPRGAYTAAAGASLGTHSTATAAEDPRGA